jgi:hypothetical protein
MRTKAFLRSSFSSNRLRAALWCVAGLGAIALIVAVIVGFHESSQKSTTTTRRAEVAQYIARVGRIQIAMNKRVRAVDTSYKRFAKQPGTLGKRVAEYRRAEKTLGDLRDSLARVVPPPDARKLHRLLVRLANQNVHVAALVTGLSAYLPALSSAQAPLREAVLRLRAAVSAAKTATVQAAAFAEYSATARRIAGQVAVLPAPKPFLPARDAEAKQLRRLAALAADIGSALRAKQLKQAQTLVGELATAQTQTSVVRAQRAAALAYNADLQAITTTAKAIEKERRRLEKAVPAS